MCFHSPSILKHILGVQDHAGTLQKSITVARVLQNYCTNKSRLLKLLHNLIWLHFLNVYVPSTPAVNTEEQGLTKKRFVINLVENFYNNGNVAQQKSKLRHIRTKKE